MALEDIDGLSEEITEDQEGHIDDHKKIVRGLKSIKTETGKKYEKPSSGIPSSDIEDDFVKSVNGNTPDTAGNVIITVSGGSGATSVDQISDATVVGKSVLKSADAAAVRTAIGAGTSNIALGTTSTTAAAGNDSRLSNTRTPTDSSVTIAKLTATGTPNATTYLRGDNTWATVSGGSSSPSSLNIGNTVASQNVNVSNATGTIIRATLAVAQTSFSFTNVEAGSRWTMEVKQDTTGSRSASWNGVTWVPSGPVLARTASAVNLLEFFSPDGSTIYGFFLNPTFGSANLPYPAPSTRLEPIPRVLTNGESSLTKGMVWLTHFIPDRDFVVSNISTHQSGTVSAGATLCRLGIYQYNGGNSYSCIARTANAATRYNTQGENVAAIVDNGASTPATINSVALSAGQEYAYAIITVGNTTEPQMRATPVTDKGSLSPRMGAVIYGATDLTSSLTASQNAWMLFYAGLT